MEKASVVILGGGTAATNAARSARAAGAERVIVVHPPELINTCVEEGCMPSKSILAGAHKGENMQTVMETRDAHITRLRKALLGGFEADGLEILHGRGRVTGPSEVTVATETDDVVIEAKAIIIATGSHSFVPPIPGLDASDPRIMISDEVVSIKHTIKETPERVLVIGAGPIGLELSTFFHDMGSHVDVLQRGPLLRAMDPEFGEERLRASKDESSFPIHCHSKLTKVVHEYDHLRCTIVQNDTKEREELYDTVLVATGRRPNTADLGLEAVGVKFDERGSIIHGDDMRTSVEHIFVAGDVTGHHQILHYAAEMGKVAGHNAAFPTEPRTIDYPRHMLAVSFDQFPSAQIGMTETEANEQGIETTSSIRNFNEIGLGILKRQEYGLWKLVAEKSTGKIIGAQVLGPDSAGELVQLTVPILANQNTAADIMNMTWYHPTYAEILLSLAREIEKKRA